MRPLTFSEGIKNLIRVSSLNSWRFYFTGHELHEFHGNDCCGLDIIA